MLIHILIKYSLALCVFVHFSAHADLVTLDEDSLGNINGNGIGIVLEDFVYEAGSQTDSGATFEISGLETSDATPKDVILKISQFYIAGDNSNNGTSVIGNPVNIGRLVNPFSLELQDGNKLDSKVTDKAVFEFSAPTKQIGTVSGSTSYFIPTYENRTGAATGTQRVSSFSAFDSTVLSSRAGERPDMGISFDVNIDGVTNQSLESHIESLAIDGSYLRLWGDDGRMEGELAFNAYTPSIEFIACDAGGVNCGATVEFQNVSVESRLGYGEKQPVTFEVNSDGHFIFEVGSIKSLCSTFSNNGGCTDSAGITALTGFYDNGPNTNAYIGNVVVGTESFGSTTISNLQIQYLHVQSHDL